MDRVTMGRYIHADDYDNQIIYKYWFSIQGSELPQVVAPFGGQLIEEGYWENTNWDLVFLPPDFYQTMQRNLEKVLVLLAPHVSQPDKLRDLFRDVLTTPPLAVGEVVTMQFDPLFQDCLQCLVPDPPREIMARLDLLLCLCIMRPTGELSSESPL